MIACLPLLAVLGSPAVELGGERYCDAERSRCVFDAGRRPLVRAPGWGRWQLQLDDRPVPAEITAAGAQRLLRLGSIPLGAHRLALRLRLGAGLGGTVAQWPIRVTVLPGARPSLAPIVQARRSGRLDEAERRLATFQPDEPIEAVWAEIEAARIAHGRGRGEASIAAWGRAISRAEAHHLPTEAVRCLRARAMRHAQRYAYRLALADLDRARRVAQAYDVWGAEGSILSYRANIAILMSRFRDADALLGQASARLEADGMAAQSVMALQSRAWVHLVLGGSAQAVRALADIVPLVIEHVPGALDDHLTNLGWALAVAAAHGQLDVPFALIERIHRLTAARAESAGSAANALTNLAWAARHAGRIEMAQQALQARDRLVPRGVDQDGTFADLLDAELSLATGDLGPAAARFDALADRFAEDPLSEPGWRAIYGVARVALARGDADVALLRFADALARIEGIARHAELTVGRGRFFDARRDLVDDTLAVLLDRGLVAEAFTVADGAQARVVRALEAEVRVDRLAPEAREAWQTRVEAYLAQRAEFEAAAEAADLLAPDDRPAWRADRARQAAVLMRAFDHAYAVLDDQVAVAAPPMTVAAVQRHLAADQALLFCTDHRGRPGCFQITPDTLRVFPLDGALEAAVRLDGVEHLFVIGASPQLDGLTERLIRRASVSRLPHAGVLRQARRPTPGPPVIVADPSLNLPGARSEGLRVAQRVGARPLVGRAATRQAVLDALDGASLLHFAGHGVLAPDAPWDAYLAVADGQRLTLADLLVARRAVGTVVLSGCDTGRQLALGHHDAVGLPTGFLSAGARTVLATTRPLDDGEPQAFLDLFYAAGGAQHPGRAFRAAARLSEAAGDPSWRAWRLFGLP